MPSEISTTFYETFADVRDTLESTDASMEGSFSIAFAGGSSVMGKIKSKAIRTFQATKLSGEMNSMEAKIDKASNLLLHLTMMLGNALKMQEHHDVIVPKLENLSIVDSSKDIFRPTINTPTLTDAINLDFTGKDSEGNPCTLEGILKQHVLSSKSSGAVTAAPV